MFLSRLGQTLIKLKLLKVIKKAIAFISTQIPIISKQEYKLNYTKFPKNILSSLIGWIIYPPPPIYTFMHFPAILQVKNSLW